MQQGDHEKAYRLRLWSQVCPVGDESKVLSEDVEEEEFSTLREALCALGSFVQKHGGLGMWDTWRGGRISSWWLDYTPGTHISHEPVLDSVTQSPRYSRHGQLTGTTIVETRISLTTRRVAKFMPRESVKDHVRIQESKGQLSRNHGPSGDPPPAAR